MTNTQTRRERRKADQTNAMYRNMKISAAVMGTTLTACAVVTPLIRPISASALETSQAQVNPTNFAAPNPSAFITEIAAHAQPTASANDLYASVMIAQAIIESGWGKSTLSLAPNYNLFGVKGNYNGQTVYLNTLEYLNGRWVTMKQPFKKYPSFKESFEDNARTIKTVSFQNGVYYYAGAWKSNTKSYRDATAWLTGRYATAPNYATALNTVIEQYGLTRYDTPASGNAGGGATTGSSNNGNQAGSNGTPSGSIGSGTTGTSTYTVVSGDSVWGISNKHGITMNQLISWNNIQNNFVYPGQKLIVKQSSGSTTTAPTQPATGNNGTANNTGTTYTVVSGDSVWGVSNKYGITMAELRSWNNIQNDFIYPGQKLIVKQKSGSTTTAPTQPANGNNGTANNTGTTYTVVSGDSVWGVSNKYGITMAELRSWNNIQNDFIYPGQKLIVQQKSGGTTTAPTQPATGNNGTANNTGTTYTVVSGDSVWGVSNKYGITMAELRSWNNIQNDFIYPGQKLIVKQNSGSATTAPTQPATGNNGTANNTGTTYTVVSGDSVWGIANKHGITMAELRTLNNIQNDFVYPGQKLLIKQTGTTKPTTVPNTSAPITTAGNGTYTVKSGESVWGIANKHGITMDELRTLNNLQNDFIYPGQKLIIKKGATNSGTYTVAAGDSVWSIAQKYGITMTQFCQWNNIKDNFIYPGQSVRVK